MSLDRVLITGASSGLGSYLAIDFAKKGHDILLHGRKIEKLKELQARIRNEYKVEVDYIVGELSNQSDLKKIADFSIKKNVKILINNAGVTCPGKPLAEIDLCKINDMIDTNLKAPIILCKYLENNLTDIININSMVGLEIKKFRTLYSSSKWGLRGFSQSFKLEIENLNILDFYPTTMQTWPGRENAMDIEFVLENVYKAYKNKNSELILDGRNSTISVK